MTVSLTDRAIQDVKAAPVQIQRAFQKQLRFLLRDLKHPSLHAKKYDESRDIWQARVNRDWRFYFLIEGDAYTILNVIPHPK